MAVAVVAVVSVIRMRHRAVGTCSEKSARAESSENVGRLSMGVGGGRWGGGRDTAFLSCRTAK